MAVQNNLSEAVQAQQHKSGKKYPEKTFAPAVYIGHDGDEPQSQQT